MTTKKTIIAGVIFLFCIALYIADNALVTREKVDKEVIESFTHIPENKITAFEIENKNGKFIFKKEGGAWIITNQGNIKADMDVVTTMLTNLNGAKKHNILEVPNLDQYGLNNPNIRITIEGDGIDGIKKETILIGDDATYAGKVFAKAENEKKIFTIQEHIKNFLNKNIDDFRDRSILNFRDAEIASVRIKNKNGEVLLNQISENSWEIAEPVKEPASTQAVQILTAALNFKKAVGYVNTLESPDKYSLDNPIITVTITGKTDNANDASSNTQTLLIGKMTEDEKGYYAQKAGERNVMIVSPELAQAVNQDAGFFRDRQIFQFEVADIVKLNVQAGKSVVDVIRNNDGNWIFSDTQDTPINEAVVVKFLNNLKKTEIKKFIDNYPADISQYGLDRPMIKVTIESKDGKTQTMITGKKNEAEQILYARNVDRKQVFGIDWTKLHDILVIKDDFMDKSLVKFDKEKIEKMKISLGDKDYTLVKSGDIFNCTSSKDIKHKVEKEKTDIFFRALETMQYKDEIKGVYISDIGDGLDNPGAELQCFDDKGNLLFDIIIGNDEEINTIVKVKEKKFRVQKKSIDSLKAILSAITLS